MIGPRRQRPGPPPTSGHIPRVCYDWERRDSQMASDQPGWPGRDHPGRRGRCAAEAFAGLLAAAPTRTTPASSPVLFLQEPLLRVADGRVAKRRLLMRCGTGRPSAGVRRGFLGGPVGQIKVINVEVDLNPWRALVLDHDAKEGVPAMKPDDPAEVQGFPVTTLLTGPGRLPRVGDTLVCPTCAVSGVVRALPSPNSASPNSASPNSASPNSTSPHSAGPICHGPMKVGRPVPCAEVRPRRSDDAMIGGRLYEDEASGFAFWCTRGGPRPVHFGRRPLSPRDMAAAF